MAFILSGKKLSEKILSDIKKRIKRSGKKLQIAGILVDENIDSRIFLSLKKKACEKVGIRFKLYQFPKDISNKALIKEIKAISRAVENHGIIIQLPLPKHIDVQAVLNLIPPKKDIDLLSDKGLNELILSPVLAGMLELFQEYKIDIAGKNIVVVGQGRLVGKPITAWLEQQGERVTKIDAAISDISGFTRKADLLISGVGQPGLITGKMVKSGVIVIDVAGDVDFKTVSPKASFITPTPGGIGPLTVAMVIKNLITLSNGVNLNGLRSKLQSK